MEKDSQVRLMSSIYSQAMSTVVWLGLPSPSSNTAIDKTLEFLKTILLTTLSRMAMRTTARYQL